MAKHNILGEKGEQIAEAFLLEKSYRILEKNWHYKKLEIDIIAMKDNYLIAVEVKTRTNEFVENMNEIVPPKKQKFIIEATDAYMQKNNLNNEVRFDIIYIVINNNKHSVEHIEDAYTQVG